MNDINKTVKEYLYGKRISKVRKELPKVYEWLKK